MQARMGTVPATTDARDRDGTLPLDPETPGFLQTRIWIVRKMQLFREFMAMVQVRHERE